MGEPTEDVVRALASIPDAGSVAVGFSGGLDSTVLLHAAASRFPASCLRALHVNHGLQPEARHWQRHCEGMAGTLGVAIEVLRVTVRSGNLEARARGARYAAWREALGPSEQLLLGHHADDQAETVLWRLFTGRAPVGMPRARPLGAGNLLRPLLHLRRSRLLEYAKSNRLSWVEDPSNADTGRDRNFIRREIVPRIESRFPGAVDILSAAAPDAFAIPGPSVPIAGLAEREVRAWLRVGVSDRFIREILRQAHAARDANPVFRLPDGDTVRRYAGHLYRVPCLPVRDIRESENRRIEVGRAERLPHGIIRWRRGQAGLLAGGDLTVRYRSGAERLAPAGRGVSKRLKTLFQEQRIPPWQRDVWPLLFSGDTLAAVPGIALAEKFAVSGEWRPEWTPSEGVSVPE